ncbi:Protein TolB [Candidatus Arsenophonus lipoptenae]|uniref:Tol-Pal system protein TolB n=1 Tax=Candidatus Arsenophonus lipoptenae TaxID=634113 RepID=A0A0X9VI34_9GAMM|nr:Tol-Pal system beta propeller repeat protein TolB [Candidatus Arsenophonus lipoptenae]AMA64600.1 Protein TolB [Candidatus Arsenophonus lipoptenae]
MKQMFYLLKIFLMMSMTYVNAEISIEITYSNSTAQPIAIVPFKWIGIGTLPYDIGQITSSDLRNSGKFNPINIKDMPQQPTTASEITPSIWSILNVNSVVVGQIQPASDGQYIIKYQLVDLIKSPGMVLTQNKLKVTAKWLRYAAHTISDEVFAKLTGIKGAFRTRIAYIVKTSDKKNPYELRVSDYDGYNQFTIHRSPEPLMSPAWSANGEQLAYVTFENGTATIVIQTLSTGDISEIINFPCHNGAPIFSPDGTQLAFVLSKTGSLNIYIKNLLSGKIKQITNNRNNNTEPNWMPDNNTIVYTSDQSGSPQIYKVNINNGIPERITWFGVQNQDPSVSPDGKFIIMVNSNNGKQQIVKQDLETGKIEFLTDTFLDETPSISPNGTMVIYSTLQGIGSELKLVSTDGCFKAHLVSSEKQVYFPSWSPYL